jgi:hypothetical protein
MVERTVHEERLNWRLPLYVVAGACIASLSMMVYSPNGGLLYMLVIAPLVCFILLIAVGIRKNPRQRLSILLTLIAFLAASAALLKNEGTLRPSIRWLLWSHRYKAELLALPNPAKSELKHVEWDGWGFVPSGNNVVYLVFDPTDSLAYAAKTHAPGRFNGLPCEVPLVRRLDKEWYSVHFYTDEKWGECPYSVAKLPLHSFTAVVSVNA